MVGTSGRLSPGDTFLITAVVSTGWYVINALVAGWVYNSAVPYVAYEDQTGELGACFQRLVV